MAAGGYSVPTYAYALNNQVRYTDPTGLCPWCAAAIWTIGAGFEVSAADAALVGGAVVTGSITGAITNLPPINWGGTEPGAGIPFPITPSIPFPHPRAEPGCGAYGVSNATTPDCEGMLEADSEVCRGMQGDAARGRRCWASSNVRYSKCLLGVPPSSLPELVTW